MAAYIKKVTLQANSNGGREVVVSLSNGGCVKICACCESWEQYNATVDELQVTVGIAAVVNEWLHGSNIEPWGEINAEMIAVNAKWIKDNAGEIFGSVADFEERRDIALSCIDSARCALRYADCELYDAMRDALCEWCADNGFNADDYDVEHLIY